MKTLIALALLAPCLAMADGKAYRYIFDHKMPTRACLAKASAVAHRYGYALKQSSAGEFQMVGQDPQDANGVAYYERGTCHVYVF